jgi:AraC-like DNA-binding protein
MVADEAEPWKAYDRAVPRPLTVLEDQEFHQWGMVTARPHVSLRAHVRRYVAWWEHRTTPLYRRELPTAEVPLIINFSAPIRLFDVADRTRSTELGSFATGAYDSHVIVEANGSQGGIQIDFTILGMRLFLGRPLADLTNRGIALEDILGSSGRRVTMELHDAPTWEARFDLLDREIGARMGAARTLTSEVLCTWKRIVDSGGLVTIGSLVEETGWSQKHLISQFREHIGLAPKTFARVMRFGRAVDRLRRRDTTSLTELALDCGYYDQAHFDRDFRAFAGVTPTELLRTLSSTGGFSSER